MIEIIIGSILIIASIILIIYFEKKQKVRETVVKEFVTEKDQKWFVSKLFFRSIIAIIFLAGAGLILFALF